MDRFGTNTFQRGVEDSLHRLKRAAETQYANETNNANKEK